MRSEEQIFKDGSTTYYWSSRFFSPKIRADVLKLYSFVRVADNLVDAVPQDLKGFKRLEKMTAAKRLPKTNDELTLAVKNMREISVKYNFNPAWQAAFLDSMRADTKKTNYTTRKQTLDYIYGSAEVIGLMMLGILRPDLQKGEEAQAVKKFAKLQGRAMQYINFIRDIDEDLQLGRVYFAAKEYKKHGLPDLSRETAVKQPAAFREFIDAQLALYTKWQLEANNGLKYIPWRERIALRTAIDMYNWTAQKIADDPQIVFRKKVKPSKLRVISRALLRCIYA